MAETHAPPPGGRFEGYAPLAVVEARHTEQKAWRAEHERIHDQLGKDVQFLQYRDQEKEGKLNAGAQTFTKLEARIAEQDAKIQWPVWKVAASFLGLLSVAGSIIWAAARYPSREEFKALQTQVESMRTDQALLKQSQDGLRDGQNTLNDAQLRMNDKLEQALRQRETDPPPRRIQR